MTNNYQDLLQRLLNDYHQEIYETVPQNQIGNFLTDFLSLYRDKHPYKEITVTEIDNVQIIDFGDWEGL